ncbi:MAG TPA: hypothetical protein VHO70_10415 [Chitinispirillaceae bacterium]|nr:hypothetical protein [Chitinispirillaceae bacterium]
MKLFLVSAIILTSLFYLFQFLKSLHLFNTHFRSGPYARNAGILSLISSDLQLLSVALLFFNVPFWWYALLSAIICSQIMIFSSWNHLKFFSITNIFFLMYLFTLVNRF